jgi:hypothetical protein
MDRKKEQRRRLIQKEFADQLSPDFLFRLGADAVSVLRAVESLVEVLKDNGALPDRYEQLNPADSTIEFKNLFRAHYRILLEELEVLHETIEKMGIEYQEKI